MNRYRWLAAVCLVAWAAAADGADLTRIDRTIVKEPAYKNKPKYCLLVFGPEAKHRVWLVMDGNTLWVDRNGNGDLTEAGEQIQAPAFHASNHPAHEKERSIEVGDLTIGGLTHTGLTVSQTEYRRKVDTSKGVGGTSAEGWQEYLDSIWQKIPDGKVTLVTINLDPKCYGLFSDTSSQHVLHFAWSDDQGQLTFADSPAKAPVLHFGGQLTLRAQPKSTLQRGAANSADLTLFLGTPGIGPGSFVTMCYDLVPKDVYPALEIQFPTKKPGEKPVTRKYVLKQRC